MWALILDDRVIEITNIDPTGRYHADIVAYDISNHPARKFLQPGWIIVDGKIQPLDLPLFLARQRRDALKSIAEKHAEMLTVAMNGATAAERDTWTVKEREALAVIAGATTSDALKPVGDETLVRLAQKIAEKAAAYRQLVGIADHIKRTAEKAVEALTLETVDDLDALDALLETAKQQALAALQQATAT